MERSTTLSISQLPVLTLDEQFPVKGMCLTILFPHSFFQSSALLAHRKNPVNSILHLL